MAALAAIGGAEARGALADLARSILPAWIRSSGGSDGPLVSFNLSGQQFLDEQFMAALGEIPSDVASGLAIEVPHLQFFVDRAAELAPSPRIVLEWATAAEMARDSGSTKKAFTQDGPSRWRRRIPWSSNWRESWWKRPVRRGRSRWTKPQRMCDLLRP